MSDKRKKDLVGLQFGYWTVLRIDETRRDGVGRWLCKCRCGVERVVKRDSLLRATSRSCGCRQTRPLAPKARYQYIDISLSHPFAILTRARESISRPGFCCIGQHRIILFENIGTGPHKCHWCNCQVDWATSFGIKKLCVDHLDNNGRNNDPVNLVPSCHKCNCRRDSGLRVIADHVGRGKGGPYNGRAKLTQETVDEMRALAGQGVRQRDLVKRFGIKKAQVSKIVNRTSWI